MLNILANPENLRRASLIGVAERLMTDVLASLALAGRPRRRAAPERDVLRLGGSTTNGRLSAGLVSKIEIEISAAQKSRRRKSKPVRQRRRRAKRGA